MPVIVLADSHVLTRDALSAYLRQAGEDIEIAGAGDYHALLKIAGEKAPDLALVDAALPGLPDAPDFPFRAGWIVEEDSPPVMMAAQVWGIFPRTLSSKRYLEGITEIMAGRAFFPHVVMEEHAPFPIFPKRPRKDFSLSLREKEVLAHIVRGASNKEIARALDLQVVTIKPHVRGLCRKLGAANRTQAAMVAMENGLV